MFPSGARFCHGAFRATAPYHQRMLAEAIKRARNIALLPYTTD